MKENWAKRLLKRFQFIFVLLLLVVTPGNTELLPPNKEADDQKTNGTILEFFFLY